MYKGKFLWTGLFALFAFTLVLNTSVVLAFHCPKLVRECKALVAKMEKRGNTDKMTVAEAKKGCEKALKLHKAGKHKESIIEAGLAISMAGSSVAQEVQRVTVTLGELSKTQYTLEPKEITVTAGKVEFVLVNKGSRNHTVAIKLKDKEMRLVRRVTPGQSVKSEPVELSAGEYELYCPYTSGGSHKEKGMVGKLIVK